MYSLYNSVNLLSPQNNSKLKHTENWNNWHTQPLTSKPLDTKVSTPLSKNVQIGPNYPYSFPGVMWLISVTMSQV